MVVYICQSYSPNFISLSLSCLVSHVHSNNFECKTLTVKGNDHIIKRQVKLFSPYNIVRNDSVDGLIACLLQTLKTSGPFSSVQFSCSVVSNPLWSYELQHARPPCPSPNPGVHSNSCPSSWWCHSTISSSVVPFSSCPQSLPASGSLPMSQLFAWGVKSTEVSSSASVFPMNTQDWSPLGWTGWISLQSKGLSRVFFNTTV